MLDAITFTPADGGAAVTFGTSVLPVGTLSWQYETASEEQPKQDASGQTESPAPVRRMTLTMVGQIVGTGASDALAQADYWAKRKPVAAALLPPQGTIDDYVAGRLSITPTGGTVVYDADVVLLSLDFPLEPGSEAGETTPRSSAFTAQMRCNYGYWQHGGTAVRL